MAYVSHIHRFHHITDVQSNNLDVQSIAGATASDVYVMVVDYAPNGLIQTPTGWNLVSGFPVLGLNSQGSTAVYTAQGDVAVTKFATSAALYNSTSSIFLYSGRKTAVELAAPSGMAVAIRTEGLTTNAYPFLSVNASVGDDILQYQINYQNTSPYSLSTANGHNVLPLVKEAMTSQYTNIADSGQYGAIGINVQCYAGYKNNVASGQNGITDYANTDGAYASRLAITLAIPIAGAGNSNPVGASYSSHSISMNMYGSYKTK